MICSVNDCDRKVNGKGLCGKHYKRWQRHGNPLGGRAPTPRSTTTPTLRDLEWAAGFLEGEGHFGIYGNNGPGVAATQTSLEPLFRLQQLFGGTVGEQKRKVINPKHNKAWVWRAYGSRARGIALTLFSLLSQRRKDQISRMMKTEGTRK